MSGIPEATPIELTVEERIELERLARSTKTEHRMRQRSRIVLMAAEGARPQRRARLVMGRRSDQMSYSPKEPPASRVAAPRLHWTRS